MESEHGNNALLQTARLLTQENRGSAQTPDIWLRLQGPGGRNGKRGPEPGMRIPEPEYGAALTRGTGPFSPL